MTWQNRFDRLLRAMTLGEPHKAEKRAKEAQGGPRMPPQGRPPQDVPPRKP